ncbi:MAG: hypothetical protein LUI13_15850 [Lachnospiraceae bacterium]|nr:hypothetical protein [Lachnospiraceae bacterium]
MKKVKLRIWILIFWGLFLFTMNNSTAYAASAKSKALKAYSGLLSQDSIKWGSQSSVVSLSDCSFALIYLDNNAIPELLIYANYPPSHSEGYALLYT